MVLTNDLASGAKPGILHQIWLFNASLGFSSEGFGFLGLAAQR